MKINEIKSIRVTAKEWFDKANGNSYFSAKVTIDGPLGYSKTLTVPFQYGYGTQYEVESFRAIQEYLGFETTHCAPLWRFCEENGIELQTSKHSDLKKWCVAYGKELETA